MSKFKVNEENRAKLWYHIKSDLIKDKTDEDIEEVILNFKITNDFGVDLHLVHDKTDGTVYIYTNGMIDTNVKLLNSESDSNSVEVFMITNIEMLKVKSLAELNEVKRFPWLIYFISDACYNIILGTREISYNTIIPIDGQYWNQTNYRCAAVTSLSNGKVIRDLGNGTCVELLPLIMMKQKEMEQCSDLLNTLVQVDAILQLHGNKTYPDRDLVSTEFSRTITEILSDNLG